MNDGERKQEPEDRRHRSPGRGRIPPRRSSSSADTMSSRSRARRASTWSAARASKKRSPGLRPSSTRPPGPRPTRRRRPHSSPPRRATSASRRGSRGEADRRRLDHWHRQVPGRLQRGEGRTERALLKARSRSDRSRGPVPRVRRAARRVDDAGRRRLPGSDAARRRSGRLRSPRRCGRGAEIENGRITEVAGPREERLADAAAALFASRGDSFEIREVRQPGDPDGVAYAEGAALPNPGAKLAGPSFEEWLAAA